MEQQGDHVRRRRVGPAHVVEQHATGRAAASPSSSPRTARAKRWRSPVAAGATPASRRTAGSATARSASRSSSSPRQRTVPGPGDHVVECLHPQREGHVALELGSAARDHDVSPLRRPAGELRQQARLADPRLAQHPDRLRAPGVDRIERALEAPSSA